MKTVTKTLNKSRQREAIMKYLISRHDHPTAEQIYSAIREDFPNISLGTVYRNLTLLLELGKIQKISCGDASVHFDGNITPHNHFVCTECNCISDLQMENLDFINVLAGNHFNGSIAGHNIYFYGKCQKCMKDKSL